MYFVSLLFFFWDGIVFGWWVLMVMVTGRCYGSRNFCGDLVGGEG